MKISIVVDHYSEFTGYTENCLPRYLAKLGVDVHVVAPNVKPYFDSPWYDDTYRKFFGPPVVEPGVYKIDGVTIHRLPHRKRFGYIETIGLMDTIKSIGPDVVQCMTCMSWDALKLAQFRRLSNYRLFSANHMAFSVFAPLRAKMNTINRAWFFASRRALGGLIGLATERCFAASEEGAILCTNYYGLPERKVIVLPLGVDTDRFHPCESQEDWAERRFLRKSMNCEEDDILCIYTGRFTEGKNPLVLAKAIAQLRRTDARFRAVFVGAGPQRNDILKMNGCITQDFVPWNVLPSLYRAADIAVWPQQESMSALDAAATGIPVVLSDRIKVVERVEGNGRTYLHGSSDNLAAVLNELRDSDQRASLGKMGTKKMRTQYSWKINAGMRMTYYRTPNG